MYECFNKFSVLHIASFLFFTLIHTHAYTDLITFKEYTTLRRANLDQLASLNKQNPLAGYMLWDVLLMKHIL